MYSVVDYGHMASEGVRMDAYARALAQVVRPGAVVLDIGAGTGIFSLLAARAGARRVHAVDVNPAVWLLRDLAAENGVSDRIQVHQCSSIGLELPEPADVVVSDLRGSFPLHGTHLDCLHDAKTRLLRPGGALLPRRDRLQVAMVESEAFNRQLERGWTCFERLGWRAESAKESVLNASYGDAESPVSANQLLTDGAEWSEIVYGEQARATFEGTVELTARRRGTAHALVLWFRATIAEGIEYDNAPGQLGAYQRRLLPLARPIETQAGDRFTVTVRASARGDRWAWDTKVDPATDRAKPLAMRQATFLGTPTSPDALRRHSTSFTPNLSESGARARAILDVFDGRHTVEEISGLVGVRSPTPAAQTLDEVRELVERYSR
jgi:type I protein arginine methyltransferase